MERRIKLLRVFTFIFLILLLVFQSYQTVVSYRLHRLLLGNYAFGMLAAAMDKELDMRLGGNIDYLITSQDLAPEVADSLAEVHFDAPSGSAIGYDRNLSLSFHENIRNAINHAMPPRLGMLDSIYRSLIQAEYPGAETYLEVVSMQNDSILEATATRNVFDYPTHAIPFDNHSGKAFRAVIATPQQVLFRRVIISIVFSMLFAVAAFIFTGYQLRIVFTQKKVNDNILNYMHHIVHQLKTPVGVIKNVMIDVEQAISVSSPSLKTYISLSQRSIGKLTEMTGSILRHSATGRSGIPLDLKRFHLSTAIRSGIDELLLKRNNSRVDISIVDELYHPEIVADELHLCDAVVNLVDNAIKYSSLGVSVTIRLTRKGKRIRIAVKDNGPGIPRRELSRIFDKFYRSAANPVHVEGYGLGLNYVQSVCKAHNGRIKAYSKTGVGSEFILWLPVLDKEIGNKRG